MLSEKKTDTKEDQLFWIPGYGKYSGEVFLIEASDMADAAEVIYGYCYGKKVSKGMYYTYGVLNQEMFKVFIRSGYVIWHLIRKPKDN